MHAAVHSKQQTLIAPAELAALCPELCTVPTHTTCRRADARLPKHAQLRGRTEVAQGNTDQEAVAESAGVAQLARW